MPGSRGELVKGDSRVPSVPETAWCPPRLERWDWSRSVVAASPVWAIMRLLSSYLTGVRCVDPVFSFLPLMP